MAYGAHRVLVRALTCGVAGRPGWFVGMVTMQTIARGASHVQGELDWATAVDTREGLTCEKPGSFKALVISLKADVVGLSCSLACRVVPIPHNVVLTENGLDHGGGGEEDIVQL